MKLRIQNTALIGDPDLGAELEIPTHGRVFDIEVVKERLSYQGMDFGVRPSLIKATTTSADDYKNWEILGSFGVDTGMAGIWDPDAGLQIRIIRYILELHVYYMSMQDVYPELMEGFWESLDNVKTLKKA